MEVVLQAQNAVLNTQDRTDPVATKPASEQHISFHFFSRVVAHRFYCTLHLCTLRRVVFCLACFPDTSITSGAQNVIYAVRERKHYKYLGLFPRKIIMLILHLERAESSLYR